jgi:hypothetical protein
MNLLTSRLPNDIPAFENHDLVRVPDGRVGEVIGFYKRQEASVLVSFSAAVSEEFLMTDVDPI